MKSFAWNLKRENSISLTDVTSGKHNVIVSVIDTGVELHDDLKSNLLQGMDLISDPEISLDGDSRDNDSSAFIPKLVVLLCAKAQLLIPSLTEHMFQELYPLKLQVMVLSMVLTLI